jgi:hypothetical protein
MSRRESSLDDYRYRSNSNPDEHQAAFINFFRPRRNVTKYYRNVFIQLFLTHT